MKRRLLSIVMAIMMVLTMNVGVFASENVQNVTTDVLASGSWDNLSWSVSEDYVLTLSGTGMMPGITVTQKTSGEYSYYTTDVPWENEVSCSAIKCIVIEDGITSITEDFTTLYNNLYEICIPKSVTAIAGNVGYSKFIYRPDGSSGRWKTAELLIKCYKESYTADYVKANGYKGVYFDGTEEENSIVGVDRNLTWKYNLLTNVLTISGTGTLGYGDYGYYNHTIERPWEQYKNDISKIIIGNGITEIGDGAFAELSNVESVVLPQGLQSIGTSAFYNCYMLKEITFPEGLTRIEYNAFRFCDLNEVVLPESLNYLGDGVFAYNYLSELTIPYGVVNFRSETVGCNPIKRLKFEGKKCEVEQDLSWGDSSVPKDLVIYGFKGSTAESLADKFGLEFVAIDDQHKCEWVKKTESETCSVDGRTWKECKYCCKTKDEVVIPGGHKITIIPGIAATCVSIGVSDGKECSVCGEILAKQGYLQATGHSKVTDAAKPATTKAAGLTAGSHCANCDEVFVAQKAIPKIKTVTLKTTKYTYDGKAKKPDFTVKDANGKTLKQGRDYTIKYTNNKGKVVKTANVGTYKAVVTFKGNYSGTVSKQFVVNPKAPAIKAPAAAKKAITAKWGKVAKQATGYEVMVATNSKFTKGKKTVKVTSFKTTSKKITKLKAKTKYYVKVRTYTKVSGKTYYSAWSKVKSVKTK